MRRPYLEILSSHLDDYDNQPEKYVHPPLTVMETVIGEVMLELSEEDSELIYLRYFDRMSLRKIRKLKGHVTHGTTQYRIDRAVDALGEKLRERSNNPPSDLE